MSEGIREIVERARSGDQVAMALLIETSKQADKGNRVAKKRRKQIQKYIKAHPPSTMAGEVLERSNPKAQAKLWSARKNKPEQFACTVIQTAPHIGPWALICAIAHGPKLDASNPLLRVAKLPQSKIAACTRKAVRLQRLSDPRVSIRSYCPMTAGELGE